MKEYFRPAIAISSGAVSGSPGRAECYEECIVRAGGVAKFLRPAEWAECRSGLYDGLLVPGGKDLDPCLYGEPLSPATALEDPERTRFEFSLLRAIMGERKPVLGICYGMQLINVFLDGSLFQDIPPMTRGGIDHRAGIHSIHIRDNPYLKQGEYEVNSSHHQAVRRMGKGLKPWAYSDDGIIEGLYCQGHSFLVGVQWHPERMKSSLTDDLFRRFIDACR